MQNKLVLLKLILLIWKLRFLNLGSMAGGNGVHDQLDIFSMKML
jgi:hypothetical protein